MKKNLQIGQLRVALELQGKTEGRPLIFLHGWGGDKMSWQPLIEELKALGIMEKYCAVAIDLPGFGQSDEPPEAWSVNDYARFLEALLKQLYQELRWAGDYDLIVHSFGGRILLKLLSPQFDHEIAQLPDKLVLIAAAGIKRKPSLRVRLAAAAAKFGKTILRFPLLRPLEQMAKKVLYRALRTHDYEKSSGVMRATFLRIIEEDLQENLNHVKNPSLIFWGAKDSYVPLKDGRLMAEKIPGSRLIVFPDGKHGIHKTKAALLAAEISKFLNNSHDG